jgi:hypothetical protein
VTFTGYSDSALFGVGLGAVEPPVVEQHGPVAPARFAEFLAHQDVRHPIQRQQHGGRCQVRLAAEYGVGARAAFRACRPRPAIFQPSRRDAFLLFL